MKIPGYDIFSGSTNNDAVRLDAVEGLGAACDKMKKYAKQTPGPYFVFCRKTHAVLAHINTTISDEIRIDESAPLEKSANSGI